MLWTYSGRGERPFHCPSARPAFMVRKAAWGADNRQVWFIPVPGLCGRGADAASEADMSHACHLAPRWPLRGVSRPSRKPGRPWPSSTVAWQERPRLLQSRKRAAQCPCGEVPGLVGRGACCYGMSAVAPHVTGFLEWGARPAGVSCCFCRDSSNYSPQQDLCCRGRPTVAGVTFVCSVHQLRDVITYRMLCPCASPQGQ